MRFVRASKLRSIYTLGSTGGADVDYNEVITLLGSGAPRQVYHSLKGSAADMTWPQGSTSYDFDGRSLNGNQFFPTMSGGDGVLSWSISAAQGNVPGRLTVASYLASNSDDSAPDEIDDYDLGPGSWDSGPLPIKITGIGDPLWRLPRIRWVPINLLPLL